MKKLITKKLSLKKLTVADLSLIELNMIKGGLKKPPDTNRTCKDVSCACPPPTELRS